MGGFPFEGKTHMVEPGIEPGTSCLVVRSSDHQATRLVRVSIHNLRKVLLEGSMVIHPDGQTFTLDGHDEAYKRFSRLCECAWKELIELGCEFVARIHQVWSLWQVSEFCPLYSILNAIQILRNWTVSVFMNTWSRKCVGWVTSVCYVRFCGESSAIKIKFVNPVESCGYCM